MERLGTVSLQTRGSFLKDDNHLGLAVIADLLMVEDLLRAHCHQVVVVQLHERLIGVEKIGINIQISFHKTSWPYPYEDHGFAHMLFHRVLCVQWFAEGMEEVYREVSLDEHKKAKIEELITTEAKRLASEFPEVAKVFERVYGLEFIRLKAGIYPRK